MFILVHSNILSPNFDKENYLDIETYSGLFGIEWIYYHWKHKA
jgi:hypothetical protein